MDNYSEIINVFESLLITRSTKQTPALYTINENQNKTQKTYTAVEVLTNVSKQLKAIQNADTATHKRVGNKLDKYKKKGFLPFEKIPVYKEVPNNIPTKFETQCVTDTQLINVIENAEIIDRHRGVTQEFDETFCQNQCDEDDCDNKINDGSLKPDKISNKVNGRSVNSTFVEKEEDMKECNDISDQDSKLFEKSDLITCEMARVTCQEDDVIGDINDEVNINPSQETQEFNKRVKALDESKVYEERSTSPVLYSDAIKKNSSPPLVVSLYTFEEFENLAHQIIEGQEDLEMAKNLINSQILGREISIPDHIYESIHRESPVLNKMKCITTNINKDNLENVNSNIIYNQGKCSSENKEMESKVIKAEIKDEILFSSDEEYEYLNKDVQELPLTCALETSFYNKSDVLDKTMYVGFQTASNKSIQIHTDSFMRAKSILSSVDSETTEATLKDLVEIFDTGIKGVNDNVQNTALTSCKKEYDTENKSLLKIELDNNEDFTLVSEYRGEDEEKIDDTFKNVSLTALEQEANVNDDIVMSQVMTCKNSLRSAKENNNIIFEQTTSDTLHTAIEQNKHLNDNFIMSQVIEFKSISRTPKSVINTSINDIFKKPEELNTKRKLEGFKTASNKKIKLFDKTMARCKKVFQDIDLNETECLTYNESKKELNSGENQSKIEDLDLQINDKTILQEFEQNEMSSEIRQNNGYVGFKTASNKNISISDTALAKTKNLFQDIMNTNTENDYLKENTEKITESLKKPVIDFKKVTGKQTQTENGAFLKTKNIEEGAIALGIKDNPNIDMICIPSKRDFSGFKTTANKKINISDQALEKTKDFYKNLDDNPTKNIRDKDILITNMEKGNFNHVEKEFNCGIDTQDFLAEELMHLEDLFKDNDMEKKKPPSPTFHGFQTASKKPVVISKIALEKGKKFFEDITNTESNLIDITNIQRDGNSNEAKSSEYDYPLEQETDFAVVQTAVKEAVSEITLDDKTLKNRLIGHPETSNFGIKPDVNITPSTSKFIGFQTASNKQIIISNEALTRSKVILEDHISENEKDMLDEVTFEPEEKASPEIKGFQTAKDKIVSISEKTLEESKRLFQDIDADNYLKDENHEGAPIFRGFQTASNKKVAISEKALAKSKKLFEDISLSQIDKGPETNNFEGSPIFKGFQTANNKKVEISGKALANSKQLFKDIKFSQVDKDSELINLDYAPVFTGFQTASCKKVEISEQALAESKQLFENMKLSQIDKETTYLEDAPVFKGFQTASNKKIEISENALAKSKKLFDDIKFSKVDKDPETTNLEYAPVFKGFQTASNKKVQISEQALAKSKLLFEDIKYSQVDNDSETTNVEDAPGFKGFQTARNKKVPISEKALAKCKQVFEGLSQLEKDSKMTADLNDLLEANENNDAIYKINEPYGNDHFKVFETDSNKKVKVSQQAFAKTKKIFKDIHEGIKTPDVKIKNHSNVDNAKVESSTKIANAFIKDAIDTQVLNDFQNTQNTVDFCKSTPKSKRSGSPILSCPRAKKRKFETPYRTKNKIEPINTFVPPKVSKTFNFNAEYKKEKKYTLKDLEKLETEYNKIEIDPYITEFKFDTLLNFNFFDTRNDYTKGTMTIEELKKVFLDSVNKKVVPDGWLDNHIKLILWKLFSYEIKYPNVMKNTCTVKNVLEQLKYRYDKELYHVQRPILRKILEKDEVASKTMILCVAEIYVDNIRVTSVSPTAQNMELLLTDGWYCLKATTDRMLVRLAANGSVMVGTKLAVCGAELINCEQGVAPWEDTSSVRLKLSGNSVRRARWLTPLGVRTDIVRCPLRAVRVDGGRVAALRVAVARVYPPLYVEKMDDGSTVTLSERLENIRQSKYESERQAVMEKLYEEVEKEMSDQNSQDSIRCSNEGSCLGSGSQISKYMKRSKEPDEYRSHLTKSQNRMLEEYNAKQREKLIERVRMKFHEKLDKTGFKTDRNVIPLVKVRIAALAQKNGVEVTKGYFSIWRPSAAVLELLTEGAWIEILNIIPTGIRNTEIQLSAGRQTVFNPYKQLNEKFTLYTNILKRKCYAIGELTYNPSMTTDYNEIDTIGMIFCIEPSTKEFNGNQNFQNVYLADADKNIICVNFWGGLKKYGFENLLDTGQIVTCVNLQKRAGNTRKSIPEYRVTEFSYFTKTPKDKKALEITNELSNKLSKIKDKFCEDCVVLKNNYSVFKTRNNENVSPYSNCNVKMVSPLKNDVNLNLTGLDFDTSFDTQDISPQLLLRKRKINEKIEKIRLYYGEPPPLSSIHIVNQSKNASANYKSPLVLNSERTNVANVQSTGLVESPVTTNRTFVKNFNPVKLNFSNASLNDNVDHFAEEFDVSPPFSLDSETLN